MRGGGAMPQKINLENFIFWRAATLGVRVYGRNGRLICRRLDPYLQVSIYLYNACFAESCTDENVAPDPWPFGGVKNGWILPTPFLI